MMTSSSLSRYFLTLRHIQCSRCIQMTVSRSDGSSSDDGSPSNEAKKGVLKSTTRDLLSILADIRVQKTSGVGSNVSRKHKVSAAANFQRMIFKEEKTKQADEESKQVKEEHSPGLDKMKEMTVEAAKAVAQVYPDSEIVESDLLKELRRHDEATVAGERGDTSSIDSLLSGFRVQKQTSMERQREGGESLTSGQRTMSVQFDVAFSGAGHSRQEEAFEQGDRTSRAEPYHRQRKRTSFERQRLNIFTANQDIEISPTTQSSSLWDVEWEKELRALRYSTVHNGFEEAMKLTEEGKLWRYPINNEQGWEEEQQVDFHEHIFLDHLLKDFPPRAQILDFMELVLIGLSKNPFLTVAQKHDHISWFREYFCRKEDIFQQVEEAERGSSCLK